MLRLIVHQPFGVRLNDRSRVEYARGDVVATEHESLVLTDQNLAARVTRSNVEDDPTPAFHE